MELYFSPLACSMATRISLYEAGVAADFVYVDSRTKLTPDGRPIASINPIGLVPVLRTDAGELITENAAILQYLAAQYPGLVPAAATVAVHEWLSFVGTELHKSVFAPLLDPNAPEGAKSYALAKAKVRFEHLVRKLGDRPYALGEFSIVDAYLVTVLTWTQAVPIDLREWPTLVAYVARARARPAVERALREEVALYRAEAH